MLRTGQLLFPVIFINVPGVEHPRNVFEETEMIHRSRSEFSAALPENKTDHLSGRIHDGPDKFILQHKIIVVARHCDCRGSADSSFLSRRMQCDCARRGQRHLRQNAVFLRLRRNRRAILKQHTLPEGFRKLNQYRPFKGKRIEYGDRAISALLKESSSIPCSLLLRSRDNAFHPGI